jgi:hypothetical protein
LLDKRDAVLKLANVMFDWEHSASDSPFSAMMSDIVGHRAQFIDKRDPEKVPAAEGAAYVRIYLKDLKLGGA